MPASVLNDGSATFGDGIENDHTNDEDNTWTSTFVLDTSANPAGYDISQIRSGAGGREFGELPQSYEVWWSSVSEPYAFQRLGDFHHIPVHDLEQGSAIVVSSPNGGPLARGVKALQFRFTQPPLKQWGFFGLYRLTRYYEVEAFGAPTPSGQALASGASEGASLVSPEAPEAFGLGAAAPNPFGASTTLDVEVAEAAHVRVVVYDALGRAVATLADRAFEPGRHRVRFDASALPSGTYVVRMEATTAAAWPSMHGA